MSTVAVKERPILFSAPMVRAILDGRKTQTRRIVKAKDSDPERCITLTTLMANVNEWREQNGRWFGIDGYDTLVFADCPYGQVGDRLWVRETCWVRQWGNTFNGIGVDYKAGGDPLHLPKRPKNVGRMCCWRPSIHMPRWASRITLEITGVRVERLNEISRDDAIAEGCGINSEGEWLNEIECGITRQQRFRELWNSINGKDSWSANPWVWVISFKRLTP